MYGIGVLKGMAVTLKNFLRPSFTVQYPEESLPQHPRFRGQDFVWYEERCTGCASCAKYCPLGIIRIVTDPSGVATPQGDKYKVLAFDIDLGRCMYCGLCVEGCPYDALHMGSGFERARYRRQELVIPVEELRRMPKRPSTWFRPQMETKGYDPRMGKELPWQEAGRHEAPDVEKMKERWVKER
ncbi:MAG: NADH-quinone oxidoreductase subunit I [Chloroflexi bacterium]|nr:NADH-quinone oxidoreductase subunit I [Chloroflexota bacterium]